MERKINEMYPVAVYTKARLFGYDNTVTDITKAMVQMRFEQNIPYEGYAKILLGTENISSFQHYDSRTDKTVQAFILAPNPLRPAHLPLRVNQNATDFFNKYRDDSTPGDAKVIYGAAIIITEPGVDRTNIFGNQTTSAPLSTSFGTLPVTFTFPPPTNETKEVTLAKTKCLTCGDLIPNATADCPTCKDTTIPLSVFTTTTNQCEEMHEQMNKENEL